MTQLGKRVNNLEKENEILLNTVVDAQRETTRVKNILAQDVHPWITEAHPVVCKVKLIRACGWPTVGDDENLNKKAKAWRDSKQLRSRVSLKNLLSMRSVDAEQEINDTKNQIKEKAKRDSLK